MRPWAVRQESKFSDIIVRQFIGSLLWIYFVRTYIRTYVSPRVTRREGKSPNAEAFREYLALREECTENQVSLALLGIPVVGAGIISLSRYADISQSAKQGYQGEKWVNVTLAQRRYRTSKFARSMPDKPF